jgi:hypothetical protein
MVMAGMSYREPECPNDWCASIDTIKWSGPGEKGYWIKPNMEKVPLDVDKWTKSSDSAKHDEL